MEGGVDGCVEFGGFIAPCGHDEAAVVDEPHEEGGFVFGGVGWRDDEQGQRVFDVGHGVESVEAEDFAAVGGEKEAADDAFAVAG